MSMRKFAQSVSEDLDLLEDTANKLRDMIDETIDNLGMLRNDPQVKSLHEAVLNTVDQLYEYIFMMIDTLEEYEKPSINTEDVLDVIEERY